MKIGIVSDTHGVLPARVLELFDGVEAIIHAGDIGSADILIELEALAPVYAVYGNVDDFSIRQRCPLWRLERLGGKKIFITHILAPITEAGLQHAFEKLGCRETPDVVVYGHTHELSIETVGGMLVVNPGSASRPPHNIRPTVAFLTVEGTEHVDCHAQEL